MSYTRIAESRGPGAIAARDHALGVSFLGERGIPTTRSMPSSPRTGVPLRAGRIIRPPLTRPLRPRPGASRPSQPIVPPPRKITTTSAPMGPLTTTTAPATNTGIVPPHMRPPDTMTASTAPATNTGIIPPHMRPPGIMTAPTPPKKPLTTGVLSIFAQQQAAEEMAITDDEAEAAIQTPQVTASRKPLIIGGIVAAAVLGVYLITRSK